MEAGKSSGENLLAMSSTVEDKRRDEHQRATVVRLELIVILPSRLLTLCPDNRTHLPLSAELSGPNHLSEFPPLRVVTLGINILIVKIKGKS